MASKTKYLSQLGLLKQAPRFLDTGVQYEVVMGSIAYGVSDDNSDMDIYGFAIPPRDWVFPHLRGYLAGFDPLIPAFEQFQQHHIYDANALGGKGREYDLTIYSIVKFFRLLTEGNPNLVDALFVPRRCVLYSTALGERVREQRKLFLHKGCWPTYKGYACTQMHKMRTKQSQGNRVKVIEQHGYDLKFAYHLVRLLNQVEQIMLEGNLELDRNREQLKAIRRGEWSMEQVENYFFEKEKRLEVVYQQSALPLGPDRNAIKLLLLECLEQHYGSIEECYSISNAGVQALLDIQSILNSVDLNGIDKG